MRLLWCGALSVFLALAGLNNLRSQDPVPAVQPQDQFFAGTITALNETSITVTRTVLGKESTVRSFSITPETHIEGKPKVKSRVTVRFVSGEEGDRAVRIIVRGANPPPKKP
ncbi:MAG: hypothetical protein U0Q18_19020 [Bryobacteraceae bacterium]